MIVDELLSKLVTFGGVDKRGEYRVITPVSGNDGDIDEIEEIPITSVVWDDAEKRLILDHQ